MAPEIVQKRVAATWELVRRQFGVVSRRQLLALGWSAEAIRHRLSSGRVHPLYPGVYAVGRPTSRSREDGWQPFWRLEPKHASQAEAWPSTSAFARPWKVRSRW